MSTLDAAIDCAYRGWAVLPIWWPAGPGRCACPRGRLCVSIGKHPITPRGIKDASREFSIVRRWWSEWPDANVAVATGAASGITVLDVDGADGAAELAGLEFDHGALPETRTVLTGRGTHHYWRRVEGAGSRCRIRPGLDSRSDGGYVIVPPSIHASGEPYTWASEAKPVEAPRWLADLLAPRVRMHAPRGPAAARPYRLEPDRLPTIAEGGRNSALYRYAVRLGSFERRSPSEVRATVEAANRLRCCPPLGDSEINTLLASAAAYVARCN